MNAALTHRLCLRAVMAGIVLLPCTPLLAADSATLGTPADGRFLAWLRGVASAPDPVRDILFNWKGWLLFAVMALASAQSGLTASARRRLLGELGDVDSIILALLVLAPLPFLGMEAASLFTRFITLLLLLGLVGLIAAMATLLVNPRFSDTLSNQRSEMMDTVGFAFFGVLCLLAFCISGHPNIQLAITSACVLYISCALPLLLAVVFARLRLGIHWLHERGARTFLVITVISLCLLISLSAPEDALPNPAIVAGIELVCLVLMVVMVAGAILAPEAPWDHALRTNTVLQGRRAEVDKPCAACKDVYPVDETSLFMTWVFGFGLLWFIWVGNGGTTDSTSTPPATHTSAPKVVPASTPASSIAARQDTSHVDRVLYTLARPGPQPADEAAQAWWYLAMRGALAPRYEITIRTKS